MKKKLIACIMSLSGLYVTAAHAQELMGSPATDRANVVSDWMKNNLKLTHEQDAKVNEINKKYADLIDKLKASDLDNDQKTKKLKTYLDEKHKELKKVLTPDQYKELEKSWTELEKKTMESIDADMMQKQK